MAETNFKFQDKKIVDINALNSFLTKVREENASTYVNNENVVTNADVDSIFDKGNEHVIQKRYYIVFNGEPSWQDVVDENYSRHELSYYEGMTWYQLFEYNGWTFEDGFINNDGYYYSDVLGYAYIQSESVVMGGPSSWNDTIPADVDIYILEALA